METDEHQLIFIPGPGMGHIVAAVEVSKLIVSRDPRLSITLLLIKDPEIHKYRQSLQLQTNPQLQLVDLPEAQIPNNSTSQNSNPAALAVEYIERHKPQVRDAILSILTSQSRISCFIVDMFCVCMTDVANEFNIPTYMFFTSSAGYYSLQLFTQAVFDDHGIDMAVKKDSDEKFMIAGFVKKVPVKVLPSIMFEKKGGYEVYLNTARKIRETKGVLINTFQELEPLSIEYMSNNSADNIPPVYPIGPIFNFDHKQEYKHDDIIFSWLDKQPASSVVFLCFGSQGSFTDAQIKQIAVALERSGLRFLWSLRRRLPLGYTSPEEVLPIGFLERTAGVGKVIGWAPQVVVLSHPSIGGFVSHCGWNSIIESLWFGVPIAAWPLYAEQQVNAFEMVEELGLAIEIKMDFRDELSDEIVVNSEEIERGIQKLMMDRDVNGIRDEVKYMREMGRRALLEGGSSLKLLGCFIHDILQNSSTFC